MESDQNDKDKLTKLTKREEWFGWNNEIQLFLMGAGDVDGIFSDDGSDPSMGYQAIPAGQPGNIRRRAWALLSTKVTGKVGLLISNPTLRAVWNKAITDAATAGNKEFQFAMIA